MYLLKESFLVSTSKLSDELAMDEMVRLIEFFRGGEYEVAVEGRRRKGGAAQIRRQPGRRGRGLARAGEGHTQWFRLASDSACYAPPATWQLHYRARPVFLGTRL